MILQKKYSSLSSYFHLVNYIGNRATQTSLFSKVLFSTKNHQVRMAVKTKDEDQVHEDLLKKVLNTEEIPDYLDKFYKSAENYIHVIFHEIFHRIQISG